MKKWFFYLMVFGWSIISSPLFAAGGPPPPPPQPEEGPVGGDAPIGEGVALFMVFSAAYAAKKYSKMKDETHLKL